MKKIVMTVQVTVVVPQVDRVGVFECEAEHDGMVVAQFVYDEQEEYADYVVHDHHKSVLVH